MRQVRVPIMDQLKCVSAAPTIHSLPVIKHQSNGPPSESICGETATVVSMSRLQHQRSSPPAGRIRGWHVAVLGQDDHQTPAKVTTHISVTTQTNDRKEEGEADDKRDEEGEDEEEVQEEEEEEDGGELSHSSYSDNLDSPSPIHTSASDQTSSCDSS